MKGARRWTSLPPRSEQCRVGDGPVWLPRGSGWFWRRRPAIVHVLWLLVLIKLVTPSLTRVGFPWGGTVGQAASNQLTALSLSSGGRGPVRAATRNEEARAEPRPPIHRPTAEIARRPRVVAIVRSWPWRPAMLSVWLTGATVWWAIVGLSLVHFRRLTRSARTCAG